MPEVASTLSRPAVDAGSYLRPHANGHNRGLSTGTPPALSPSLQADTPANPSTSTAPVAVHRAGSRSRDGHPVAASTSAALLQPPGGSAIGSAAMSRASSTASSDVGAQHVQEPRTRADQSTGTTAGESKHHPSASNASTHTASSTTSSAHAAREAAGAAAKSFKVTLDDPCWKVLPAALKKYKINDDWRQYAMFICYGNTGAYWRRGAKRSHLLNRRPQNAA